MMGTSQDIGMSQYEMESSGVFSDADHHPARKSSLFFDPKILVEQRSGLEPELVILPSTILPELAEENDVNDVKFDFDENDENARPQVEGVQEPEEGEEVVVAEEDLTPRVEEVQQVQQTSAVFNVVKNQSILTLLLNLSTGLELSGWSYLILVFCFNP